MLTFLGAIVTSLSLNIATSLIWDGKIKRDNKELIEKIKLQISEFNRNYDNTEVDTNAFKEFFDSSDVIDKIYTRVFKTYMVDATSIYDFKKDIVTYAVDEINEFYSQYNRSIQDETVFFEYFSDLVDALLIIRESLLTLKDSIQLAIITEKIDITKLELMEEMKAEFEKMREDNVFAEDRINRIIDLVSLYRFSEAEKEISEILEAQTQLSKSQRELVYYQRARIFINTGRHSELEMVSMKIKGINNSSKFISEINYHIACARRDDKLLYEVLDNFKVHKYSADKIFLKHTNFIMLSGDFHKVIEMITDGGALKEELLEYPEAHFYFGNVFFNKGEFEKAYEQFNIAFELDKNIIYKYNSLISFFYYIFNNKNFISGTKEFFDLVKSTIDELKEIKYLIEYLPEENIVGYWISVINLISLVDPKQALYEITEIDRKLDSNRLIKSIKADVYFKNYMDNEAKEILEELLDDIPVNIINLFTIYTKEENWHGIISKFEQIVDQECKKHPRIIILYIKAQNIINGYKSVREDIIRFFEIYSTEIVYTRDALSIVLENRDSESFTIIFDYIKLNKNEMYDYELKLHAEVLNKYRKFEESRNLIENKIQENESLLNIYIQSFEELDERSEYTRYAYEKVKFFFDNGCRYKNLLKFKIQLEILLKMPRKVISTLEEYRKKYGSDEYFAYHYVLYKLEKNEYEGIENEAECLLSSQNTSLHHLVAVLRANQGNWEEAKRLALRALYLSHENLGKENLINYISIFLSNIDKEQDENTVDSAILNSVITLKRNDKVRNIAIHNSNIINESGEVKFDCENFGSNDSISLILLSLGTKGEKIKIDEEEYEVINIGNLYAYFLNFCYSKLLADFPDNGYLITNTIQINDEDPLVEMKETMASLNENKYKQLEMYNFGVEIGLPISYLSGKNIDSYSEMIISLLNHKNQYLYAGEISLYKNKKYILSLSAIVILATFGLLDKIERIKQKCMITCDVEKSIKKGMKESQKHAKINSAIMTLNEDGNLSGYFYNEKDKWNKKIFWTNIFHAISKINKVEVEIDDNKMYEILAEYILDEDLSSIELSKKNGEILVCDDLFIRKLHHTVTETLNNTNSIGFIVSEGLATLEELIDIILKLVRCNYLYSINALIIYEFYQWILSIKDQKTRDIQLEKLKEIYNNILDSYSIIHYRNIHEEFVKMCIVNKLPIKLIYELVKESFEFKPLNKNI
ncbi:MAG: hypothetical protein CVV02_11355 [Firmicutes bacterium HGW-Firmicutes-7]|nr:MAG: hypothetical protein CVV02_11355 [Firmicutes bacterium HGW-Firmicutes-7]